MQKLPESEQVTSNSGTGTPNLGLHVRWRVFFRCCRCKPLQVLAGLNSSEFDRVVSESKRASEGCSFALAERKGFEPLLEDYSKHDFQSCALDQLSHLSVQVAIRRRVGRTPATCLFYHTSQDLSRGFPKNAEKKLSGAERRRIQASVPPSCPCGFVPVCAFSVRERVDSAGCVPPWQEPAMAQ